MRTQTLEDTKHLTVRMPVRLCKELERESRLEKITLSEVIRVLVEKWAARQKAKRENQ